MTTPTQLVAADTEAIRNAIAHVEDVTGDLNERFANAKAAGNDLVEVVRSYIEYAMEDASTLSEAVSAFGARQAGDFHV